MPSGYALLIVNSGVKHSNTGGGYNQRVAACRAGAGLLESQIPGITHLRDVEDVSWDKLSPLLPEQITVAELTAAGVELGDIPGITNLPEAQSLREGARLKIRARCRHVWAENWRVRDAVEALRDGDVAELGRLMRAAHASARDNYEISCSELEILVNLLDKLPGVVASRLTGAGWGGCVAALAEDGAVDAVTQHVQTGYQVATGIVPDVFACRPGSGAGYMGKANGL
ncbi:MAG: hypothetical protein GY803_06455 [Chloroflexi bacterium]|nr:hypothetical protein [Chloroflexota bacterium]